jgi:hypothetical protein
MRGRMVGRAPLRRHRPGLRGGVVETTGEGASGQARCRADALRKPSPLLDVVGVAGGVAGASAGVSASAGAEAGVGVGAGVGAGGTLCTCVPRSG